MKYVVEILLAVIALWSAHAAGMHYALSKEDPKHKHPGILRSLRWWRWEHSSWDSWRGASVRQGGKLPLALTARMGGKLTLRKVSHRDILCP
jgi:hypothetical protein